MIMIAGWGSLMGVLSISSGVSYDRATGWLRQLRATPLPPSWVVIAKAVVSTLTAIPTIIAVGAVAVLLHGAPLPLGRWLLVVTGLTERLAEAGGQLETGSVAGGGWRLAATVPVDLSPPP